MKFANIYRCSHCTKKAGRGVILQEPEYDENGGYVKGDYYQLCFNCVMDALCLFREDDRR